MTPSDRELFERLCVALAQGYSADPEVDMAKLRWEACVIKPAKEALSAIRTAEAETPDAEQPNPWAPFGPGEGKCAFGYPGGSDLQARLKDAEARLDRMTQKHDTATSDAARFLAAVYEARDERDAAEGIIHAMCDERALARDSLRVHRGLLRNGLGADDPKGATDEDELTDVERRVFERLPIDHVNMHENLNYYEREALDSLWSMGAARRVTEPGIVTWQPIPAFIRKPARLVLPVGHVPGLSGIRAGMLLQSPRDSVRIRVGDVPEYWRLNWADWFLAAPFEVPND